MNKIIIFGLIIVLCPLWANWTRMNTLMVGDYIDDPVNIDIYPQHIMVFSNYFYGDILPGNTDFGFGITPIPKYGGFGVWQHNNFNIGYAITRGKFDIGIMGSPVKDHTRFGLGVGYTSFNKRIDFSGIINDETNINEGYSINARFLLRKSEYIIVPRYSLNLQSEPYNYQAHNIGLLLQRLILNDGFVFLGFEYLLQEGDIESDRVYCHAGFELPLNKTFILRMGAKEEFDEKFRPLEWVVNPGIGLRIREFNLDFHLNEERLFDKEVTFFKSFGLDLNFGSF